MNFQAATSSCRNFGGDDKDSERPTPSCRHFLLDEILSATKNFDESLVIGRGGFGKVYKGNIFMDGSSNVVAAIKRLDTMSSQGAAEFWAEVEILSKLRHRNLVSMIGYCNHEQEMILVYEYMSNGTLEDHLHKLGTPLSWLQRLKICIGAAHGLDYLHTGTGIEYGVIHRDVKSSNIMLHESWAAKVSDFGLSKIVPTNQPTYVNTIGYMDPDYFSTGKLTRKSDVYAFGVVMLELLCRRRAVGMSLDEEQMHLARLVKESIKGGNLKHIVDSDIRGEILPKCLKEFVQIAERCLHTNTRKRLTMAQVLVRLENVLNLQEKYNNSLQPAGRTLLGRMVNMLPFSSDKRRAAKMDPCLLQQQVSGMPYESCVSVETPAPGPLDVYQTKNLENLYTHNSALNAIIAALEDESKKIIGIYGLGGVGKTTLAKEVAARVTKSNLLFADVAFTSVSQKVDVEKIKKDLENATQRMMKGDKILIILDDVWEKLNLEELGIECGNMNCKILLTSRSEKVCQGMSAQCIICANPLLTEEAWNLFKHVVGERLVTDANLKPVALEVVEECGGLPLLIQAIGNALKDESIKSWESALSQLKKPSTSEMERDKAFTRLQLSYEYLKSEEAKSCFLLCSFFAEDDDISLEDLVCYGVGLKMFDSVEDAREGIKKAVNVLTSSGLLLNSQCEGYTKMHNVVRDAALLIAFKGENKILVEAGKGLKEWQPGHNNLERYTGISLMHNNISKLPDYEVHLSSLDIFVARNNPLLRMISDEFIKGMKEVKVLDLGWCLISHLPQSLKLLTRLHMLNLEENYFFHEISILGEMKELKILILNRTGIKEIPKEIGRLVNLRRFEVSRCRYMTHVTPGVISKLQDLEELCIDFSRMSEGVGGCTAEVMNLSKLTYLDLFVKSCEVIPEGFNSERLKGFVIQIGEYHRNFNRGNELRRSDRYLIISSEHLVIPLLNRIKKFIEVSRPIAILNGIQNLNNIMPDVYHRGFNKLEHIQLNYCHNVSCLVEDGTSCVGDEGKTEEKFFKELKHLKLWYLDNLKVLWKYEYINLTNLVTLIIEGCDKLERVFTVSVAQSLVNLKKLDIKGCSGLEEVIWGGGSGGGVDESRNVIVFPSLATISLTTLDRLQRFFNSARNRNIEYPSLMYVKIHDCEGMKIWGSGIHKTPKLTKLEMDYDEPIVVNGPLAINEAVKKIMEKKVAG